MICFKNEMRALNPFTAFVTSPFHSKAFQIPRIVIQLRSHSFSRKIRNWSAFAILYLTQGHAQSIFARICTNNKLFAPVWKCKYWRRREGIFEPLNFCSMSSAPYFFELDFFSEHIGKIHRVQPKVRNKFS